MLRGRLSYKQVYHSTIFNILPVVVAMFVLPNELISRFGVDEIKIVSLGRNKPEIKLIQIRCIDLLREQHPDFSHNKVSKIISDNGGAPRSTQMRWLAQRTKPINQDQRARIANSSAFDRAVLCKLQSILHPQTSGQERQETPKNLIIKLYNSIRAAAKDCQRDFLSRNPNRHLRECNFTANWIREFINRNSPIAFASASA